MQSGCRPIVEVWPPRCTTFVVVGRTPTRSINSHADHEKRVALLSTSIYASGSVAMVMVFRFSDFKPPELRYETYTDFCNYLFGFPGSMFRCDSLSVLFSHCVVHMDARRRNKLVHQAG